MILIPIKHFLSEIASLGLASSIDLGAPRLLIVVRTAMSLRLLKKAVTNASTSFRRKEYHYLRRAVQALQLGWQNPTHIPVKQTIYVCIFYRWIQCRPRTHLATLRNRVKSMYVLVSEIHVEFQLNMVDTNRLGSCRKKLIPKGQDH